jgi:VWFA-related protein
MKSGNRRSAAGRSETREVENPRVSQVRWPAEVEIPHLPEIAFREASAKLSSQVDYESFYPSTGTWDRRRRVGVSSSGALGRHSMVRHLSIVATFCFATPLFAQSPTASSPTSTPTIAIQAFGQEIQKTPGQSRIRANVSLVSTPVVVRDAKGKLAMGLSEEDFRVFDNGVEQTLEAVEMSGAPLSVAIVVENSSRIEALLPALRRTGMLFTRKVLGEGGEAAVISYGDEVVKLLDLTGDDGAIEKTFADLRPGIPGARFYDALSEAVDVLRNLPPSHRHVIVTLAEAFDKGSEDTLSQVLREAQIANITIYSVGLSTMVAEVHSPHQQTAPLRATPLGIYGLPAIPGSVYTPTVEQLRSGNIDLGGLVRPVWAFAVRKPPIEAIAVATGGRYQSTVGTTSIETAIDQIAGELNTQYALSYRRAGSDTLGYHRIKVEVVGQRGLTAHYRAGYYLFQP